MTTNLFTKINIKKSKTLTIIINSTNQILKQAHQQSHHGATNIITTTTKSIQQATKLTSIPIQNLNSINIKIPKLIHPNNSVSHTINLNLNSKPINLTNSLEQKLNVPITIKNNINTITIGTHRLNNYKTNSLTILNINTKLATNIIINNHLHRDTHSTTNKIKHIPINPTKQRYSYNQINYLKTITSNSALSTT